MRQLKTGRLAKHGRWFAPGFGHSLDIWLVGMFLQQTDQESGQQSPNRRKTSEVILVGLSGLAVLRVPGSRWM